MKTKKRLRRTSSGVCDDYNKYGNNNNKSNATESGDEEALIIAMGIESFQVN